MALLILSIVGPDRPGLVRGLSEALAAHGGSWLESRMARLAGQFAGIVRVEAPDAFLAELPRLQVDGLRITTAEAAPAPSTPANGPRLMLEIVGNDRPGIVHEVTQVLASRGVNIEELTTSVDSAAFTGDPMFHATIVARAPSAAVADSLGDGLERLSNEMMVDIQPLEG